ncbi:MAG: glycerophosphodiester phosphodiesterase [Anaerolineae bacterium]
MGHLEIVAHRGVADGAPENTLAAFERAVDLGADAIELDVRLSKDRVPVVFHNFYLDGKTEASGPIFAHTSAQLWELELVGGESPEGRRIPTFREVLEAFAGRLGLEIELKGPEPESSEIVAGELQRFRHLWDTMEVTSYEPALLLDIGRRCPGLATDLLVRRSEDWMKLDVVAYVAVQTGRLAGARAVHLHPTQLFSEVVSTVRAAGLEVHSWDVNDADSLQMMKQLDIPKFDTDNLRLALQFRRGLKG